MSYQGGSTGPSHSPRFDTVSHRQPRNVATSRSTAISGDEHPHGPELVHHHDASPSSSRSASLDFGDPSPAAQNASASPSLLDKPRIRISKACTPCRKVKLKCNGGNPCGRCLALSLPVEECTYPPSLRGKTRRKKAEIEAERRANLANGTGQSKSSRKSTRPDISNDTSSVFRPSRTQDSSKWDDGWTMRQMKEDFAKWKHDEELVNSGPRNANLWHNPAEHRKSTSSSRLPGAKHAATSANTCISPSSLGLDNDPIPDRYTTLPFPGDAHNPLGVLAEASASAGNVGTKDVPSPSPFQPTGGPGSRPVSEDGNGGEDSQGYYIPLERVLKKDAPHIMSLISVHE